jgi:hypothetical protein
MTAHIDATFFAQVEPEWGPTWQAKPGQERPLWGAKVIGITQKKPSRPKGGTVLVKLTIRLPEAAFMPLRPEAIVVIPADMTEVNPIEVIAEEPA